MSERLAFSVYDDKAGVFSPPFFMVNKALAIRFFGELVLDVKTAIAKHPSDFKLFYVGTFNEQAGELSGLKPDFLCTASDMTQGVSNGA